MRITSEWQLLDETMPERTTLDIKNEPMLFNCDWSGAVKHAGPLTLDFLERLPPHWRKVPLVIDSRVHMLMPGWYPCIPGWHHDDVPRTRSDGQPNYGAHEDRSEHITALVGGEICPTAFALGSAEFTEPDLGRTIYADWHRVVERKIRHGELRVESAPTNRLIAFTDRTWHRGTAAIGTGWRFFIRASRYWDADGRPIERRNPRTNEERRQVQVYLGNTNGGW